MKQAKKDRKLARDELYQLLCDISEEYYSGYWANDFELELWQYVRLYNGSSPNYIDSLNMADGLKKLIPKLYELSNKAGGWFAYGITDPIFIPIGPWNKIYSKFIVKDKATAQKAIENYDFNLPWREEERKRENTKWYKWRNKNGQKAQAKANRARKRSEKRLLKSRSLVHSMSFPLKRSLNYQEIANSLFRIEPMPKIASAVYNKFDI